MRHVLLALPLWGTFIGPSSSFCGMDVDVSVVEASGVVGYS